MPKLPVIKAKILLKTLLKSGFVQVHQSGSHVQLKHSDGRRTTIPNHPSHEIPNGTLRASIRDLHISVEDFVKLIK